MNKIEEKFNLSELINLYANFCNRLANYKYDLKGLLLNDN